MAATVVCALLLAPGAASAWRQAMTREVPSLPMHVEGNCVQYTIREDCSADVPVDECRAAIDSAVAQWTAVDCSYMRFATTDPASCCRVGYLQNGPNVNCVMWREDDWPAPRDSAAVGQTTITYSKATGRILDADVEMNGFGFQFTTGTTGVQFDIWNTMAHEAGHMFGLDESDISEATMGPRTYAGDISKRDLHPDDIDAACTLYPVAADPGRCEGPYGGLDLHCYTDEGCGCRAAGASGPARGVVAPLLLLFLGIAVRRRRRRSRTGPPGS